MGFLSAFMMGNRCVKKHKKLQFPTGLPEKSKDFMSKSTIGHKRHGSSTSTVSGDDIRLVWANSLDSRNLFDQLGANDIFKRFNSFLEGWKFWQDKERQCKEILGFDLETKLVDSLCVGPSGMRIGLGCDSVTEDYDFYIDVDPIIQLDAISGHLHSTFERAREIFDILAKKMKILIHDGGKICQDLTKILEYLERSNDVSHELDNPEQLKEALTIVKVAVITLKSYGTTITHHIMEQRHNVDIVVSNKQSSNPTVVIFPRQTILKVKTREMNKETYEKLNQGKDDEKYIEISLN